MKNKFKKKEKQVVNIILTTLKWKWLGKIISTLIEIWCANNIIHNNEIYDLWFHI